MHEIFGAGSGNSQHPSAPRSRSRRCYARCRMLETLIVVGLIALLAGAGWAAVLLPWTVIALAGAACAAFGFLLGVPTGFYYHVLLYRFLQPRGVLPRGWYWHPMRYHEHLL